MRLYTRNELKIAGIITGAVSVVAVFITFLVLTPGRNKNVELDDSDGAAIFVPDISDFEIPDEFTLIGSDSWIYSREQQQRWTEEQVARFWIDPAEISFDILRMETDAKIQELLEKIP